MFPASGLQREYYHTTISHGRQIMLCMSWSKVVPSLIRLGLNRWFDPRTNHMVGLSCLFKRVCKWLSLTRVTRVSCLFKRVFKWLGLTWVTRLIFLKNRRSANHNKSVSVGPQTNLISKQTTHSDLLLFLAKSFMNIGQRWRKQKLNKKRNP